MWRGRGGWGRGEKSGEVADCDENGGAKSKGEGKRVAEHGVEGIAARRATLLHTRVRKATWVTPDYDRKSPDSDKATWGWYTMSSLTSSARPTRAMDNASSPVSGRKRTTPPSPHLWGSWQLVAKELRLGSAARVSLLERRWGWSFGGKPWGGC